MALILFLITSIHFTDTEQGTFYKPTEYRVQTQKKIKMKSFLNNWTHRLD